MLRKRALSLWNSDERGTIEESEKMVDIKITYPDELRDRVVADLRESEKVSAKFNKRIQENRIMKALLKTAGLPTALGVSVIVEEIDKNSCIVKATGTGVMDSMILGMFRKQAKRYGENKVKVEKI